MILDLDLPREIEWPLVSGQPLPGPPPKFLARVTKAPRIEDIPWFTALIVSHKVRDIMMEIDGHHLKSYPVKLDRSVGVSYCVMHCQRILTCHDRTRPKDPLDWRFDASRVPKDTHIFHPRNFKTWFLVSDVVRTAIKKAKCTGGFFYPANTDGT